MNRKSPILFALFVSFPVAIAVGFLLMKVAPNLAVELFLVYQFSTLGFVFLLVYTLSRFFIYSRLKQLYVQIHSYRKNDIPENAISAMEFGNNIFDDINKEVGLWAKERKDEIDRLKKLETYRKEYVGNVSHELKTPIFNIQGYIMTLLDGGLSDETINIDYLQRAENSVERMIGIVDDLEAISQLEAGQLALDLERFELQSMVKEIIKAEEMKATTKGIILSMKENPDKPVWVFADKFRIRQVLTNLIVNSIKYGKEFGETKVKFTDVGDQIRVEVADTGIGIDEKHLSRLFERFYRVDKHRSREQGGTGLGLSIVKHILEAHNQSITVMSKVGNGSTFTFTLKKA